MNSELEAALTFILWLLLPFSPFLLSFIYKKLFGMETTDIKPSYWRAGRVTMKMKEPAYKKIDRNKIIDIYNYLDNNINNIHKTDIDRFIQQLTSTRLQLELDYVEGYFPKIRRKKDLIFIAKYSDRASDLMKRIEKNRINDEYHTIMNENTYDNFPINILESTGYIVRESFGLMVHTVKIWYKNRCILNERIEGVIRGEVDDDKMHITLRNIQLESYITNSFSFAEISHNKDRILWSNDLFSGGYSPSKNIPAFMSMFYQMGDLSKVQFSNQIYVIEFYGTTSGYNIYEQIMNTLVF